MATSVLRPNSTVLNTGALTGGGSAHAVLADNSNASYLELDSSGEGFEVTLDDLSLPAGAVVKRLAVRVRTAKYSGVPPASMTTTLNVDPEDVSSVTSVTWGTPTTTTEISSDKPYTDAAVDAATVILTRGPTPADIRVYEVYCDAVHVAKPTVTVNSPTGTLTTDNAPAIGWTRVLDADGGSQTLFQFRVFNSAQYGAGGFNAGTSACVAESGIRAGEATSWDVDEAGVVLPNGVYKAYGRVAQTVNGEPHWSDWTAGSAFTINVPLPAVPELSITGEPALGRIAIEATDPGGGAVTTDLVQIQRLIAGGGWQNIRTALGGGLVAAGEVAYDYEAPNGADVAYRARAIHGS